MTQCRFLLWRAWRRVNDKPSRIEGYYGALQGDAEEVRARVEAGDEARQEERLRSRSHDFAAEHYAASLWEEAIVMLAWWLSKVRRPRHTFRGKRRTTCPQV